MTKLKEKTQGFDKFRNADCRKQVEFVSLYYVAGMVMGNVRASPYLIKAYCPKGVKTKPALMNTS